MVTTITEKIKENVSDIYMVSVMILLSPLFLLFWIVSLTKGGLDNEEDWK